MIDVFALQALTVLREERRIVYLSSNKDIVVYEQWDIGPANC
jgi:hypothetical protein